MGTQPLMVLGTWLLIAMMRVLALNDLGYSVERYDESPGIYYEKCGVAVLYNTEWKTLVYVNLSSIDSEALSIRRYIHHEDMMCQLSVIRNWTACAHFGDEARAKLNELTRAESLVRDITGQQMGNRKKRGVFNFIGELSKIIFGTLDEDDAKFYNDQIKLFERDSEDVTALLKQQLSVVKSSLGAVNNTLVDVEYNEQVLREGVRKVTEYTSSLRAETSENLNLVNTKIEVERHILRATNAMSALQRKLDLIIDSIIHAQKGVIQPQIVSPGALMESLIKNVHLFPKDTIPPFPLSKDSTHLLLKLCDLQVYIRNGILGYVILLPMVNRGTLDIYRLIPVPVSLDHNQFLYIETGKSFLWIDQARKYYFLTDGHWITFCRLLIPKSYVCKQNQPLLSSHLHENCMVQLLQPRGKVPTSCDKRMVEISHSVWTQLSNNAWIYFVPKSETVTVLCGNKPPVDVVVSGIGKLSITANCKGFGKTAIFQTHAILNLDTTGYESDFLSKVHFEYDCCEDLDIKVNLSSIRTNTSFRHVVSHLDDLKMASHRISEVENLIKEHEWRRLHVSSHTTYSTLVYVCLVLMALYTVYKLYSCCKRYQCLKDKVPCVQALSDATGSGNVVNIKIHTSNESLAVAQEDVPLRDLSSQSPDTAPRRSSRRRASKSCF
jgi:hypothetical protein